MFQKAVVLFLLLTYGIGGMAQEASFKEGDVLFQDLDCGPLCNAIEAVTEGISGLDFSHVGWVVKRNHQLMVLEAIGSKVQLTVIDNFLKRSIDSTGNPKVVGMRFKKQYSANVKVWQKQAMKLLDKPYDQAFLTNNDSLYCAELFTETCIIKGKPLFKLQPMTFKDPNTGDFFPAWVDYYRQLGIAIPENKPGLNPGAISRSPSLYLFYRFGEIVH